MLSYPIEKPIQPAKEVDVQCPSCGATRATTHVALWDLGRQEFVTRRFPLVDYGSIVIMLFCGAASVWLITTLYGPDALLTGVIVGLLLTVAIMGAFSYQLARREARAIRVHRYECLYCHHKWIWKEGTPTPRYNRQREIWQDYQEVFGHPPHEKM